MMTDNPLRFKHVIIDPEEPQNPHIKAVGDANQDGFIDITVAGSNGGPWSGMNILTGPDMLYLLLVDGVRMGSFST